MPPINDALQSARSLGDWGFVLVIVFVALEVVATFGEKLSMAEAAKSGWKSLETIAGILLIGALAMEYIGHKRETGILDSENSKWHLEAQQANVTASSNLLQVAILSSNNFVLRSNVLALELRLAETTNNIAKIDPMNRPVTSVSATVFLMVDGTNGLAFNPAQNFVEGMFSRLSIGNLENLKGNSGANGDWDIGIHCVSAKSEVYRNDSGLSTTWVLKFEQNAAFPDSRIKTLYGRDVEKWNAIEVELSFIPAGTEIISGQVTVVANPVSSKTVPIRSKAIQSILERYSISENSASVLGVPGKWQPGPGHK